MEYKLAFCILWVGLQYISPESVILFPNICPKEVIRDL